MNKKITASARRHNMIDSVSLWIQVEQILDQENHENLCNCVPWNEGGVCVTYGELKPWSLSAHRAVEVATPLIQEQVVESLLDRLTDPAMIQMFGGERFVSVALLVSEARAVEVREKIE